MLEGAGSQEQEALAGKQVKRTVKGGEALQGSQLGEQARGLRHEEPDGRLLGVVGMDKRGQRCQAQGDICLPRGSGAVRVSLPMAWGSVCWTHSWGC